MGIPSWRTVKRKSVYQNTSRQRTVKHSRRYLRLREACKDLDTRKKVFYDLTKKLFRKRILIKLSKTISEMKCGIVVVLSCVGAISCIRHSLAGKISLVEATRPSTQVRKLPYCPINLNIITLLKQISNGLKGKGGTGCTTKKVAVKHKRIRRGTLTWPYNCGHAALTYHLGEQVLDLATAACCNACDFPAFTICLASNTTDIATRCPHEALQCIEQCIDRHLRRCDERIISSQENLSTPDAIVAKVGELLKLAPRLSKPRRCGTTKKNNAGSFCLERSCIPININNLI